MRDDELYLSLVMLDEEDRMRVLNEALREGSDDLDDTFDNLDIEDLDIDLNDLVY